MPLKFGNRKMPLRYVHDDKRDEIVDAYGSQLVDTSHGKGCVADVIARDFVVAANLHNEAEDLLRRCLASSAVDASSTLARDIMAWFGKANKEEQPDDALAKRLLELTEKYQVDIRAAVKEGK